MTQRRPSTASVAPLEHLFMSFAGGVRVSAKVDYAVRAAVELASAESGPMKGELIAQAQDIPLKFLENILGELKHAGLVRSQRGTEGGYWLGRPPEEITIADIIRAVEGPLASVRGASPESLKYGGTAEPLGKLWVAVRANLRAVLEEVTLADIARGELPDAVDEIASDPSAWLTH
jgi:Rrf2 family protein